MSLATLFTIFLAVCLSAALANGNQKETALYTAESIYKLYGTYSTELEREPRAVRELITTLIQVVMQQNSRLGIVENILTSVRKQVDDATVMFEKISKETNSVDEHRGSLPKTSNMFLPWNTQFKDKNKLLLGDIVSMNDTLNSLGLQVSTMHHHLEEVEAIATAVKRNTVDNFAAILNNALPLVEQRVEQRCTDMIEQAMMREVTTATTSTTPLPVGTTSLPVGVTSPPDGVTSSIPDCSKCAALTLNKSYGIDFSKGLAQNTTNSSWNTFYTQSNLSAMYGNCPTEIRNVREKTTVLQMYGSKAYHVIGSWMQDGYNQSSTKVWMVQGYRKLCTLLEFSNVVTFVKRTVLHTYGLPFQCGGTGHIVYNSSLFCPGFKSDKIYKYNLITNSYKETKLKGRGIHDRRYGYSIKGFNNVDLLTDSLGIWVVYSNEEARANIIVLKLNPVTLETEYIAHTDVNQTSVMNCFMINGNLYTLKSKNNETGVVINKVWSIHDPVEIIGNLTSREGTTLTTTGTGKTKRKYEKGITLEGSVSQEIMSADYNPRLNRLYTWSLDNIMLGKASLKWFVFDMQEDKEGTTSD